MSYRAFASKERIKEMANNPIFFCKYEKDAEYNYSDFQQRGNGWISCDPTINLFISESILPHNDSNRKLFFIENLNSLNGELENKKNDSDDIYFEVTEFNTNNSAHWLLIFSDCAYNFRSGNRLYCHMALFWALYSNSWDTEIIREAWSKAPNEVLQICNSFICSNIYVFSLSKQKKLISFIQSLNPQVTVQVICSIEDALKELSPTINFDNYGLFEKVDYIVAYGRNSEEYENLKKLFNTSRNCYIYFKFWLLTPNHGFYNYNVLEEIHSYVDSSTQLTIAKRYLHDVRLHTIELDYNFIKNLRDLKFPTLFHIRNFIERPGDCIDLSSLLFCDILLTLKNSNGNKIQDFNGILDLAVIHSNPSYPHIDLGIQRILPECNGGLIPNPEFIGFIHYSIVYDYDESLVTNENLKKTIDFILDQSAELQFHYCCNQDNSRHLEEDVRNKCASIITSIRKEVKNIINEKGEHENKINVIKEKSACPHLQYKPISPLTWRPKPGKEALLDLCLDISLIKSTFTEDDLDYNKLEAKIHSFAERKHRYVFLEGKMPKELAQNHFFLHIFKTYYKPTYIIIYPNEKVYYSSKKDFLGVWQNDEHYKMNSVDHDEFAQNAESPIIYEKTFLALKKMYPKGFIGENYVAIQYDESELCKVKDYFYYKHHEIGERNYNGRDNKEENPLKFLYSPKLDEKKIIYCTPKLADTNEKVSNLPYFWCRSKECFCNVLENQTLEKQNDWRYYSLYHAAELIGYKLIDETDRGNVPKLIVAGFAAEVRQAERFYARLICRACGHMIFSLRGTILHGSRFFSCQNPSCKQYRNEIYLSQCSNCKRGLIDSRDSKKCENGWVICPNCLSCCDDNLFNSLISKHRRNGYVPPRIQENAGKGHNNKGIFFCPKCATKLEQITIEVEEKAEDGSINKINKEVFGCPKCKTDFEKELKTYKDPFGNFKH